MPEEKNTDPGHGQGGTPGANAGAKADGKYKIDRETAEAEFIRFCEENDLDCDMDGMTDEEKKDFKPIQDRFVKACMRGRVEVDGVNLKYTISEFSTQDWRGKTYTIKRPDGHAFIGMDGYKETQSVHRMNGFLSAMTGQEVSFFTKIDRADWLFFRDIATLFLVG
jgi:hypothetical protein